MPRIFQPQSVRHHGQGLFRSAEPPQQPGQIEKRFPDVETPRQMHERLYRMRRLAPARAQLLLSYYSALFHRGTRRFRAQPSLFPRPAFAGPFIQYLNDLSAVFSGALAPAASDGARAFRSARHSPFGGVGCAMSCFNAQNIPATVLPGQPSGQYGLRGRSRTCQPSASKACRATGSSGSRHNPASSRS